MFYYVWGWGEIIHCIKWLCQFCCKLSFCCSAINSAHNTCENHHAPFRGGKSLKKSILVNKPFLMALWISGREHNSRFTLLTKSASLLPANKTRLHVREGWDHSYRNRGVLVSALEKLSQSCIFCQTICWAWPRCSLQLKYQMLTPSSPCQPSPQAQQCSAPHGRHNRCIFPS